MPKIKVKLRVVGIYFNETVEVNKAHPITVKDVMVAYRAKYPLSTPGGLDFREQIGGTFPSILTIRYNVPPGKKSLRSGRPLNPGIYEISEQAISSGVLAWQYYVLKPDGSLDSGSKSVTYSDPATDYKLVNESTIIWRAVGIIYGPNGTLPGPDAVV
jgi:hypothetical protein